MRLNDSIQTHSKNSLKIKSNFIAANFKFHLYSYKEEEKLKMNIFHFIRKSPFKKLAHQSILYHFIFFFSAYLPYKNQNDK